MADPSLAGLVNVLQSSRTGVPGGLANPSPAVSVQQLASALGGWNNQPGVPAKQHGLAAAWMNPFGSSVQTPGPTPYWTPGGGGGTPGTPPPAVNPGTPGPTNPPPGPLPVTPPGGETQIPGANTVTHRGRTGILGTSPWASENQNTWMEYVAGKLPGQTQGVNLSQAEQAALAAKQPAVPPPAAPPPAAPPPAPVNPYVPPETVNPEVPAPPVTPPPVETPPAATPSGKTLQEAIEWAVENGLPNPVEAAATLYMAPFQQWENMKGWFTGTTPPQLGG